MSFSISALVNLENWSSVSNRCLLLLTEFLLISAQHAGGSVTACVQTLAHTVLLHAVGLFMLSKYHIFFYLHN